MKTLTDLVKSTIVREAQTPKVNEFVILKPGFLKYEDDFCNLLKNNGWNIIQKQKKALSPEQVQKLYGHLSDKPFFSSLCNYMASDQCLCCSCSKDCEDPIKEMKELKKKVREQWGEDDKKNAMHCSDSEVAVINEVKCCLEGICERLENFVNQPENNFEHMLICKLQDAFAEEINAWYQYIVVCKFLHGSERKNIEEFYEETAKDEFEDHAMWLLNRINELSGTPNLVLNLYGNNEVATHKYIIPDSEFSVVKSLLQNIEAEKGAIETYKDLEAYTRDIDPVTHTKIKEILADEEQHLTELQDFLADIH